MPLNRHRNTQKQYSLSTDKKTHERMAKLSRDTGISRQQLTNMLLNVALDALGNGLESNVIDQRDKEREARKIWITSLEKSVSAKINPDIIAL